MSMVIGSISGGMGSWAATRRYVDQHGAGDLHLLFTDTLCEDQDGYRFLIKAAADLFGAQAPEIPAIEDFPAWEDRTAYKAFVLALAASTSRAMPRMHWVSDGRDPWDVYEAERFLGNSSVDPCSKILKRQAAATWLKEHCNPADTTIIFGIDHEEEHRFFGGPRSAGIKARWLEDGWETAAPLCDAPYLSRKRLLDSLDAVGLWLPRLNRLGFSHNNCGGHCCKGGHGHWRLMLDVFPERYAYVEWREQQIRELLGKDVAMLTDRRGGEKNPLTLASLRTRTLTPVEAADMGACNCFTGDAA